MNQFTKVMVVEFVSKAFYYILNAQNKEPSFE